jgi:flagellar L-ring protein precursor FlgH
MRSAFVAAAAALAVLAPRAAAAQSSSLYGPPDDRVLALPNYSFYYIEPEPPREVRLNDLLVVVVQHTSQFTSEGEVQRTERSKLNAVLADWLELEGLSVKPATQSDGDLRVSANLDGQLRQDAELENRNLLRFRIAARVVDIRPNGNLVLEAHQNIENNHEVWKASLVGEVSPEHVLPDGSVLSENIADLHIRREELGHVREGTSRGWLLRLFDKVSPF